MTGFEAGGVDYISKPIRDQEVLMRARTHPRIRYLTRELDGRNRKLPVGFAQEAAGVPVRGSLRTPPLRERWEDIRSKDR